MKIARDLPKPDQEQKQPKKPYITPRLIIFGDIAELTRGTTGARGTDVTSVFFGAPGR